MRTKKAILTIISDIVPQILLAVIGLIKSHFFIANLGTDVNGLYTNYSQIMRYITIVDGGLTSAILYRLYKPIAKKDDETVSKILSRISCYFSSNSSTYFCYWNYCFFFGTVYY